MKIRFIYNPSSGHNRRRSWLPRLIRDHIVEHRLDAALAVTERAGHATQLAREALAAGCHRVVAVGGDGTMNEVAQALVEAPASLGLIPCGSGNGLARSLRLPTHPQRALDLICDPAAETTLIDTGLANDRPFFNAMGSGLDAEMSRQFNRLTHRGLPAYARTGLDAFFRRTSERIEISWRDRTLVLDALLVTAANSDQYGNGARIAPGARVDDGLLDLVAVRPVGLFDALQLVVRLFAGGLDRSSRVVRIRSSHFTIRRARSSLIHTDGETHVTDPVLHIQVRPASLRLLVPPSSRPQPVEAEYPVLASAHQGPPAK